MEFVNTDSTWGPFDFSGNSFVTPQPLAFDDTSRFSQGQILDDGLESLIDPQLLSEQAWHAAAPSVDFVFQTSAQLDLPTIPLQQLSCHATVQPKRRLQQPTPQDWERWKPDILRWYRNEPAAAIVRRLRHDGHHVTYVL